MAVTIPNLRYVGWDIAVTPDGVDLIEANQNADHALFERIGNEKLFFKRIKELLEGPK